VDWASDEHAVCVVDERGRILEGRRYRHNESGVRALCARLVRLGVALVALERPDGLLIERRLDAGLAVIAVHPNQVKASRPRYSVAGGKSDSFDSFVLAELGRTDSHRFRVCARGSGSPISCAISSPAFGRALAMCSSASTRRSRWRF
jgi:hypothetical protein